MRVEEFNRCCFAVAHRGGNVVNAHRELFQLIHAVVKFEQENREEISSTCRLVCFTFRRRRRRRRVRVEERDRHVREHVEELFAPQEFEFVFD